MAGIGEDKDTAGSNHILSLLKDKNNEPIWFLGWGGMNTLMQAIWKIEKMVKDETISEDEKARMLEKIRIFDIAAQDNSCSEIAKTYPDIFYVRSTHQFFSFSKWKYNFNAPEKDSQKGDLSFVNHTWFRDNVQDSKFGDFGKEYPDYRCLYEGDTPSFLYLIQNGLSDPMKPHYGSWAGRFSRNREYSRGAKHNNKYDGDGYVYTDEHESVKDGFEGVNDVYACLWRWREDYQNDFAARMLWTISDSFNKANHNPVVIVNGDETKSVLHVKVQKNRFITLEAGSSYDPDSDTLNYSWWQYKEPGTYRGSVSIEDNTTDTVKVTVPADANSGDTIHIVLTVRDNGDPV
ncbi:MAG TPA: DUF1593 domain-containing protein, partial [Spirochaetota bacterium]|nr:DUF1593 domain-containing protein [Spirochaetota bacterium]